MLNLDIGGRVLVLPQRDMPDFVDSPWKASPFLRSGLGVGRWKVGRAGREKVGTGIGIKMRKDCFKK